MTDSQILKNILDVLINNGDVLNLNDLSGKLPHDYGSLNKIINDKPRCGLTAGLRVKLHNKYGILHSYMLTGKGEIFEKPKIQTETNTHNDPNNSPAVLLETIKHQNKLLDIYEKEIESLKFQLAAKDLTFAEKQKLEIKK